MAKQQKRKVNGYKMPEPLPNGFVLNSADKRQWKLGSSIGKGGFGEIYLTQDCTSGKSSSNYPYVTKIEPHENGPLFVEMHAYMRIAKLNDIEEFKTNKKLNSLGMPQYITSGSEEYNKQKYRFLVMEKFGTDLWKLFIENKNNFPPATTFKVAIQILDVLEYMHSRGYIHADIKAANILLGLGKESTKQVYLVDFGLCGRYDTKYKPDPKKAHNGTVEYLSRDAHYGVQSRRGDLEILGYNIIQWLGCKLPWEENRSDAVAVQKSKEKYMDDLPLLFKTCFGSREVPDTVQEYFKYISKLEFDSTPDYEKLRKILKKGVITEGSTLTSSLEFKSIKTTPKRKQSPSPSKKAKKIRKSRSVEPKPERDTDKEKKVKVNRRRKAVKSDSEETTSKDDNTAEMLPTTSKDDSTAGYTAEMLRVKAQLKQKKTSKAKVVAKIDRPLRQRKAVNYKESANENGNKNGSVDVISDSEDEKPARRQRKK